MKRYCLPSAYDGIFSQIPKRTPTHGEPDGPLTGNGDIGLVFGMNGDKLSGYVGKNDMWCLCPAHKDGGMKNVAVLTVQAEGMEHADFSARQFIMSADLSISLKTDAWTLRVDSYAPYTGSEIVMNIACEKGKAQLNVGLELLQDPLGTVKLESDGRLIRAEKAYDRPEYDYPTIARMYMKRPDGGPLAFALKEGESVCVVSGVRTNFDGEEGFDEITESVLAQKRAEHDAWWEAFWSKSKVSVPSEPMIEKFWYGSLYLMACSSKAGKFAPGIFGPFVTGNDPSWGGDYHLNYNYEAPWWGVFSSNHVELAEPYDQPLMDYIPKAQAHARELLGCRGLYSIVGIGPKGNECAAMFNFDGTPNWVAPFWGQKSNAAYGAINMVMRYYATMDEEYARKYAYPYMREVADFWEDYLVLEGDRYVIYNDSIHENVASGKGVFKGAEKCTEDYSDDMNPIVSLGLVRLVMKTLLHLSEVLGVDADRRKKWADILARISPWPTQERGGRTVFRYTEKGKAWHHEGTVGLQHIYPGRAIGLSSDPEILQIAVNTLEEMPRWEDFNGFPTIFCIAAVIGYDPDTILMRLNRQLETHGFDNLFVYYGGGGLECASTVPAVVDLMLMQSHEGVLRLFPVWNKARDASFENLRAEGAFLVSAALRDGTVSAIRLFSEKGMPVRVVCPWPEGMRVCCNGKEIAVEPEAAAGESIYCFSTEAGKEYILDRAL